jgi:hypothetical protein
MTLDKCRTALTAMLRTARQRRAARRELTSRQTDRVSAGYL